MYFNPFRKTKCETREEKSQQMRDDLVDYLNLHLDNDKTWRRQHPRSGWGPDDKSNPRIDGKNEEAIGGLLQLKMIEIMMLGNLLGVNPFNQPNVENYKKETRRIMSK